MQEAGRILLMPKGDYAAGTAYTMLDLVNHSGASWVCKKDCTGQEPSDSNTEFWQRFGTAVDLSNYLSKSGGVIETLQLTPLELNSTGDDARVLLAFSKKGERQGWLGFNGVNTPVFYSQSSGFKDILHTGNMASHVLPLNNGSTIPMVATGQDTVMRLKSTNGNNSATVGFSENDTVLGYLGFNGVDNPVFYTANASPKSLLHTGNKPTGTYTGNGSATQRDIAVGGIGNAVLVWKQSGGAFALVTRGGYVGRTATGFIGAGDALLIGTNLIISTTSQALNENGVVYEYRML